MSVYALIYYLMIFTAYSKQVQNDFLHSFDVFRKVMYSKSMKAIRERLQTEPELIVRWNLIVK